MTRFWIYYYKSFIWSPCHHQGTFTARVKKRVLGVQPYRLNFSFPKGRPLVYPKFNTNSNKTFKGVPLYRGTLKVNEIKSADFEMPARCYALKAGRPLTCTTEGLRITKLGTDLSFGVC